MMNLSSPKNSRSLISTSITKSISCLWYPSVFGFILSSVGTFKGFYTWGGAKGVGIATTQSVVAASIAILVSNYFLAILLFKSV